LVKVSRAVITIVRASGAVVGDAASSLATTTDAEAEAVAVAVAELVAAGSSMLARNPTRSSGIMSSSPAHKSAESMRVMCGGGGGMPPMSMKVDAGCGAVDELLLYAFSLPLRKTTQMKGN
jgi:hypothetical protein